MSADKIVTPILAAAAVAIVAALSVWAQQAWLAPSLGSAILMQLLTPDQPSARPYTTAVGQLLGAAAGFASVYIARSTAVPPFIGHGHLVWARGIAIVIAILLVVVLQLLCKAINPAGGATAVIVAVGAESPNWDGVIRLVIGIALITILGEASRRLILRLRMPAPD